MIFLEPHQGPVRKISMTLLLSDPSTFEGGELEFMDEGKQLNLNKGKRSFLLVGYNIELNR
jgi:predicted 2-oxoglutarate/Fe(II)-dependent dioxygenase YbiX